MRKKMEQVAIFFKLPCQGGCGKISGVKVPVSVIVVVGLVAAVYGLRSAADTPVSPEPTAVQYWDESAIPISRRCAECHRKEYDEWVGSHHAHAWRKLSPGDAGAFVGQKLRAHGMELSMEQAADGRLQLRDTASGQVYAVDSVVGHTPLAQFLVRWPDGGLQTPSAAWDVEKKEWYDVFRDDAQQRATGGAERKPGEWGHWTGRGMNWNSQCAWCHMSGFRKNYQMGQDRYASTWQEPGVSCVQCHRVSEQPAEDGCMVSKSDRALTPQQHDDNCASCHARREELTDQFTIGDRFDDHYRLELPRVAGVFYPNAVQREEDYCETGFRLSRMGNTGVTCYDCHNPHTGGLVYPLEEDQLCLQCHSTNKVVNGVLAPQVKRNRLCGGHAQRCVDCHMPEMTYMGRDPRRDHALHWPDPRMSMELGVPNPCLNCHRDKDDAWAADYLEKRYGKKMEKYRQRFRAVGEAMQNRGSAERLLAAWEKEEVAGWRATMLGLLSQYPRTPGVVAAARKSMTAADPLERAAAAALLEPDDRKKLLSDPVRVVRHAAGWQLFPQILRMPEGQGVLREMYDTACLQSDQPTGAMQLAMLASAGGDAAEAERQYRRAIGLDPLSAVARMDYAVFLARGNRLREALQQMLTCTEHNPDNAEAQYRLGILLVEVGLPDAGMRALEKALRLQPDHAAAAATLQQLRRYYRNRDKN